MKEVFSLSERFLFIAVRDWIFLGTLGNAELSLRR